MRVLVIFLVALLVRAATAIWIQQPGYMDSYYYYNIAENLYQGRGFVEDFVWNYLVIPPSVSHASNLYWMPLSSVIMAAFFTVFGASFRAAQIPMIVISSVLPVISYLVTRDMASRWRKPPAAGERYALGAAAFTIFSGVYFVYFTVPESFGLFGVFGACCLYFTSKGMRSRLWYYFAAGGATAGLAQLTRADGVLLALVVFIFAGWIAFRQRPETQYRRAKFALPASVIAYLGVLSPWLWRNYLAFGQVIPSSSLKAAFLREYNDMFAYGHSVDLSYYLASGWIGILGPKLSALGQNFLTLDLIASVYLLPFVAVGWWGLRKREEMYPVFLYTLLLYLSLSLVFTFPGPRGAFLHSGAVLLPFLFGPALLGMDWAVEFGARIRRNWSVPTAQINFTYILVGFSAVLSIALATRAISGWDDRFQLYSQIASWTQERTPKGDTVMVVDPPAYYYVTKQPSVVFSNDGLSELVDLAKTFNVRYVVLEPSYPKPLHDFYAGQESHPALELAEEFADKGGKLVKIYRVLPAPDSPDLQGYSLSDDSVPLQGKGSGDPPTYTPVTVGVRSEGVRAVSGLLETMWTRLLRIDTDAL